MKRRVRNSSIPGLTIEHNPQMAGPMASLGNLAVSQPSCLLRVTWQLGTETVLQLNDPMPAVKVDACRIDHASHQPER
ncbi:hypothetical protein T265_05979 [Opisthorchis viverrini]|uniref:Uncharacterized protein n=1 Tax=Opisthorchis viverrini TaxID=6198 RepID=A0A074ZIM2_OPIVI|nr:hypothetical protein T265_05979 [Opisthorchis viverrini]KER26846.1 hypothetical protein T265_05979 [Opisthorchis viverrini]